MIILASSLLIHFEKTNAAQHGIPDIVPYTFFIIFILLLYIFYRIQIISADGINVLDLLWRVFVTGLVATLISLLARYFLIALEGSQHVNNPYFLIIIFNIHLGLSSAFLVSIFLVWKHLILYQKSKSLLRVWQIFEYSLLVSFIIAFFHKEAFDVLFNIFLGVFLVMALFLSANLKWVAYLNFKQKWKSILLILLVALYLMYFVSTIQTMPAFLTSSFNMAYNITLISTYAFCFIYSVFSILVILFNLPTSSVFEQKFEEVINFQRLSQSRDTGHDENQVYDILLESSVSAVMANAAWLEIYRSEDTKEILYHKIGKSRRKEIIEKLKNSKIKKLKSSDPVKDIQTKRFTANIADQELKSVLAFPLFIQNRELGMLYLLKDLYDGFSKEMIEIIRTFANQASISIENFRLLKDAIDNERYKEQLKIAKSFQRILLPAYLEQLQAYEIAAYSKAAAEVGGDFYDSYRIDEHRAGITIGDVSGKGTSAAFSMSQMKAIFQSLNLVDMTLEEFTYNTNRALSKCLERTLFITAIFLQIDTISRKVRYARAGHCPLLYYRQKDKKTHFRHVKGMGLGLLRDERFRNHIVIDEFEFNSGDILLMYTDGITEARNNVNEEFGYDRLMRVVSDNAEKKTQEIEKLIVEALYAFCGARTPDDDFTLVTIKFK